MKNNGKSGYSITFVRKSLTYLSKHTNLDQPEQVKQFIASKDVSNGYKKNLCLAYDKYCQYNQIEWQMPKYRPEAKTIKIPTKAKLEMLIARAGKTLGLKLTISKETGLRPVELHNLKTKDIDLDKRTIHPTTAKNGAPRQLKISNSLKARLENYINTNKLGQNDKTFQGNAELYGKYYRQMRNSLADKLHDQTLKTIRLYDFRHYFATMLYNKTRDILYVKQQMGHRRLETTLIYTQLLNLNDDEWTCKIATNTKQASELIEAGFQFVAEKDNDMLFRKRK
jgi:integrase